MTYQTEYPELANALYLALQKDAFYQSIESTISEEWGDVGNAMVAYMDYSICEAKRFGECYIPKQQHYGISVWSKPLNKEQESLREELKKEFIVHNMGYNTYQIYRKVCDFMSDKSSPVIEKNAWYLSIIGILPEFQGQGLGPGLVESVLEKTDKLGVATYLETFAPRNITFYQRLGYQICDSYIEPVTKAEYWLMQRLPLKEDS